jgi:hypothetical protein
MDRGGRNDCAGFHATAGTLFHQGGSEVPAGFVYKGSSAVPIPLEMLP